MEKVIRVINKIPKYLLIFLGPGFIICLALFRTIPSLIYDQPTQFFTSFYPKIAQYGFWIAIIITCLACELLLNIRNEEKDWRLCKKIYFGSLVIAYGLMVIFAHGWVNEITTSPWNIFYVEPDTKSYTIPYTIKSVRTPVYPLFTQIITNGTSSQIRVNDLPFHQPISSNGSPLLQIVQVQKLVLFCSALLLAFILMDVYHSILPIPLLLFILDFDFFTTFKAYVLSEALAQSFMMITMVCLFIYIYKTWRWSIPLAGLFSALALLTRPSSTYVLIIFFAMILWAILKDFKQSRLYLLASIIIAGGLVLSYMGAIYVNYGKLTISPLSFYQRIGTAMLITSPQDVNLMPDNDLKHFYQLMQQGVKDYGYKSKTGTSNRILEFDTNIYRIALPAAHEMAAQGTHYSEDDMLDKTANIIIANHPKEFIELGLEFFRYSWDESRFNKMDGGLLLILGVILILSVFLHNKAAYCSFILLLTHFANLVISSVFGIPLYRYTRMTEMLIIFSLFILFAGVLTRCNHIWVNKLST